ncbi:MAG: DUF554 domain-containing protein [Bacillota bacterium]|nr:DUF554 domain-containing protein [Bacillota bacterium]
MTGVLVNTVAVFLGGFLGLLGGKLLTEKLNRAAMTGLALCVLYIGISGALKGENVLFTIAAMVLGSLLGTLLDIDGKISRLGEKVQELSKDRFGSVAEGFVTASLLFCVGAMAVTGSLDAGLRGDNATLYAKSALDFVAAIMLASTLGFGVALSGFAVLVYQGLIALLAGLIAPLLSPQAVSEMACTGSLLIIALGLNMLGLTKIKVADLLPAILIAPVLVLITSLF